MDELKERILSESSELFMSKGCKTITMDGIAGSLGISKRTIYEIFKDKEDLLEQAITYRFEKDMEIIKNSSESIFESLYKMCRSTSEIRIKMHMSFIAEMKKYYPKVYRHTFLHFKKDHVKLYEDAIKKGINEQLITGDVNPLAVTYIILDLFEILTKDNSYPYDLFTKRELFYYTVIKYMRGIATLKGIKIIDNHFRKLENKNSCSL